MNTAYVTGADRGLGLGLTKVLLDKGFRVFAGSFLPDWPELTDLASSNAGLTIVPLDVSDDASVNEAAARIRRDTDRLDLLVNNAGIGLSADRSGTIQDGLNTGDMLKLYNTNALGALRVTESVLDLLLAGSGKRLVNISSEAGSVADNWRTKGYGYCMSKAALNMGSAILQFHLKEFGVKVMNFHPGWVRSYISGAFNENATVDALDSASGILAQALAPQEIGDTPSYTDYEGKPLRW